MQHRFANPNFPPAPETRLFSLLRGVKPFTSTDGQAFANIGLASGGSQALPIRSLAFRDWYLSEYTLRYQSFPTAPAFQSLIQYLESEANYAPAMQRLSLPRRIGAYGPPAHPTHILLDLANPDGEFVEISPEGWKVAAETAFFQTSRSTREMPAPVASPEPAADSPLDTLRSCLNFASHADWLRCLAWLLSALRPTGPYPVLILQGPPSSGKSVAARILRTLVDPSSAPLTPIPNSSRDLLTLARHNRALAFDHISALSTPLADTLCRISTGTGDLVREPGRPDPLLQHLERPILLTVTDRFSCPPDLAARALFVTLPALAAPRPRLEILNTIENAFTAILGALCTAVGAALANYPSADYAAPRLPEASSWAQAAAPALNCTASEMRQACEAPPPPPPLVQSILTLLEPAPHHWTGTATQLLPLLGHCHSPKGVSQLLNRHAQALASAGIQLQALRSNKGDRLIDLSAADLPACALDASQIPPPSTPSPQPPDPKPLTPPPDDPSPSPQHAPSPFSAAVACPPDPASAASQFHIVRQQT